jgi:hypothetical protein
MADYASNTPISRPINVGWEVSWDCAGLLWNNDWGMFFQPVDDMVPIALPQTPPRG